MDEKKIKILKEDNSRKSHNKSEIILLIKKQMMVGTIDMEDKGWQMREARFNTVNVMLVTMKINTITINKIDHQISSTIFKESYI